MVEERPLCNFKSVLENHKDASQSGTDKAGDKSHSKAEAKNPIDESGYPIEEQTKVQEQGESTPRNNVKTSQSPS